MNQLDDYLVAVIVNRGQMTREAPEQALPLQASAPHQFEDIWPTTCDLACRRSTHTANFEYWYRVLSLEPSGPEAEALLLGHRGPIIKFRK
ncbi:hypothetical protein AVEN_178507-1 [Araneus ventricosus]|uniref:Uncharacterized protein n=1 Tax=Araneus ventricosus TaxID=182803 RepID=A0A4Y2CFK5_ARAVE|nr:hypothetical protein AVEN_178507-1 [Araneus ventricosus]